MRISNKNNSENSKKEKEEEVRGRKGGFSMNDYYALGTRMGLLYNL